MELLSGGDMLVRSLQEEGVDLVFGYPGGAVLHIYDALFKQKAVRHILVRHEQAATHAADGYTRPCRAEEVRHVPRPLRRREGG